MSLLAGFDIVTEISNGAMLKWLKATLAIGNVAAQPPFELTIPLSGTVTGEGHLVVSDLVLDLNADDTVTLGFSFERASVIVTAPFHGTACPLSGTFAITAALQLVGDGISRRLSLNFANAAVELLLSEAAATEIVADLAIPSNQSGPAVQMLTQAGATALKAFIQALPPSTLGPDFRVVQGEDGSLSNPIQYERLEAHCIADTDRARQAIGLFGILLVAHDGDGDYAEKEGTAISADGDGMCVSIAPSVFHALVFCPALASAFGTTVGKLPTTCGEGSVSREGVTVTQLKDSFADGHIAVHGSAKKSGFCYEATAKFQGTLTPSVTGGRLSFAVDMQDPDVDVDIPWYCYVAVAVVFGILAAAILGVLDFAADAVADSLAGGSLDNVLGSTSTDLDVGMGVRFNSATTAPAGITLQGLVLPPPFVEPGHARLFLNGSVTTTASEEISNGVYTRTLCPAVGQKDYAYSEYAQTQTATCLVSGELVTVPFSAEFALNVYGTSVALGGPEGEVVVPNVFTLYAQPLGSGGIAMVQDVHVRYVINANLIQLSNNPAEGNYALQLMASARDCNGTVITVNGDTPIVAGFQVRFEGNHVQFENQFYADMATCAPYYVALGKYIRQKAKQYHMAHRPIPTWQWKNYPAPDEMLRFVLDLAALPEADELLPLVKLVHGDAFYRAIWSEYAATPARVTARHHATQR